MRDYEVESMDSTLLISDDLLLTKWASTISQDDRQTSRWGITMKRTIFGTEPQQVAALDEPGRLLFLTTDPDNDLLAVTVVAGDKFVS